MKRYNPTEIEQQWQDAWDRDGTYVADLQDQTRPKYFGFSMLPGITGAGIHIGHGRTYQFSDIKVRAKRQQGFNVYHPIGWDSFGLPVENYAIKLGKKPRDAHDEAKVNFKRQLKRLGYSYDWTKEISTADPSYYKWTQWIFNQLFKHDLAYQKQSPQWWCETDQTVLANEQVEGGNCWRCGNPVVKKNLKQWFFKITEYADEMLAATDDLYWTESVKTMQKNWIGKSQGAEVEFQLDGRDKKLTVFTTRPDTLFGATFLVVAPEHPLAKALSSDDTKQVVEAYIASAARKSEIERMNENREKTGVFSGAHAINPVNGAKIPIWIADYVLAGYGTGAIMAVPAHDERDGAFAEKFHLPIIAVIEPETGTPQENPESRRSIVAILRNPKTNKYLSINWGKDGGNLFVGGGRDEHEDIVETAKREIIEETGYKHIELVDQTGRMHHNYFAHSKNVARRIEAHALLFDLVDDERDAQSLEADEQGKFTVEWLDESQIEAKVKDELHMTSYERLIKGRNWTGEGVMINSDQFDGLASSDVREKIVEWLEEKGVGRTKTTFKMRDWLISRQRYWGAPIPIIHCHEHGAVPVPDDQLPVILPDIDDYKPSGGNVSALAGATDWVNTTCPICDGPAKRETDTLDGYACSSWYFLRYLDPFNDKQAWDPAVEAHFGPVDFYNGADHAVAHLLYSRFWTRFFHKIGLVSHPEPFKRMMYNAYVLAADGRKMSKSLGNVVDPMEIMDSGYGADSLRVYEMFAAPYDQEIIWDPNGVPGTYRFLNRVWNLTQEYIEADTATLDDKASVEILSVAHKTVKKVTDDIENDKFNTAVSCMMEAVNAYYKLKETYSIGTSDTWKFAIESLLQVLAPFAPHLTEELWSQLGHTTTIHVDAWPAWDEQYLHTDEMTIIVQVNGKLRAKVVVSTGVTEEDIKKIALGEDNVKKFVAASSPQKVIYIPGRLVNIVI